MFAHAIAISDISICVSPPCLHSLDVSFSWPLHGLTGIDLGTNMDEIREQQFRSGSVGQDVIHCSFRVLQTVCFEFAQKYVQKFDETGHISDVDLDESLWHVVMGNFCNTHGSIKI